MPRKLDLTGQDFGRLTVIDLHGLDSQGRIRWECLCDCGQLTRVMTWDLVRGHTRSCARLAGLIQPKRKSVRIRHAQPETDPRQLALELAA